MAEIDADGVLHTTSGKTLPPLSINHTMFMDATTVIYGPSKTGKTVIIKNIMKALSGHVDQVIAIAPTEPSNKSYSGFIDPTLIHYRLFLPDPTKPKKDDGTRGSLRFLNYVIKRQEMMAAIYGQANDPTTLANLYAKLPREDKLEGMRHITDINTKRTKVLDSVKQQYKSDMGRYEEKTKAVNDKFKKMLILLYKKYITARYDWLYEMDLTDDERVCLTNLEFNPRLLLIFDDCAAELKPLFRYDEFRKLFYQNRHSFITVIISCQDDTDLPTNLRKNAFLSFFTEPIVAVTNFTRASNSFSKPTKRYIEDIVPEVITGHRKLVYMREDDNHQNFYYVQFPYPRPFLFGSDAIKELCTEVRSVGVGMDKENPYYDRFKS